MQKQGTTELFSSLHKAFMMYLKRFADKNNTFSAPIKLKIAHTFRVVREIRTIAEHGNNGLIHPDIAKCTALLHDIGRFQQYASFGTYDDRTSIDHAALGTVIIDQFNLLSQHPEAQQNLIRTAIIHHNHAIVPENLQPDEHTLAHMLRDADKLDIWKLTINQDMNKPVDNRISPENLERLRTFRKIPYAEVETKADARMFRISWVFDVHFPQTIQTILSRGYIKQMFSKLPRTKQLQEVQETIENVLQYRLKEQSPQSNNGPFQSALGSGLSD